MHGARNPETLCFTISRELICRPRLGSDWSACCRGQNLGSNCFLCRSLTSVSIVASSFLLLEINLELPIPAPLEDLMESVSWHRGFLHCSLLSQLPPSFYFFKLPKLCYCFFSSLCSLCPCGLHLLFLWSLMLFLLGFRREWRLTHGLGCYSKLKLPPLLPLPCPLPKWQLPAIKVLPPASLWLGSAASVHSKLPGLVDCLLESMKVDSAPPNICCKHLPYASPEQWVGFVQTGRLPERWEFPLPPPLLVVLLWITTRLS